MPWSLPFLGQANQPNPWEGEGSQILFFILFETGSACVALASLLITVETG